MEIREPKYKVGDKVTDIYGETYIICNILKYRFDSDEYIYGIEAIDSKCSDIESEIYLKPVQKSVWDLGVGDEYYHIEIGHNQVNKLVWDCEKYDFNSRSMGNAFLTKEEAEFELERRKIETEMLRFGGSRINKWNAPVFITCGGSLDVEWANDTCWFPQGAILFEKCEDAENAIYEIGEDRIKKYIFGVEPCME